jgi:2-oxoglutarate dehydrogenase E2 component (dihydrolipoamide succinyltransferase)
MSKWIPLTMVAALTLFAGCKKSGQPKAEPPAVDTAAALPAPPELEPVDDLFADSMPAATAAPKADSVATKKTTPTAAPAVKPIPTPAATATPAKPSPAPASVKPSSKAAPAATTASSTNAGTSSNGAYTLQVGIFNNEKQANATAEKLKAQGFPAYVTRVQDPKPTMPGTYYRVRVGSFATSEAARAYGQANLAPAGVDFWADLKGHDSKPLQAASQPVSKAKPVPAPAPAPAPKPAQPAPAASSAAPATPAPAAEPTPAPASTPTPAPATQDTKPANTLPDW